MERYYICILSILLDLMLTGSTNYENPVNYIWISGFKTLTLVFKKIIYIQNVLVSVNQGGHICYIYFSIKKKFGETFYPLWSSLFSEVMPRKIKGDAPKKSLWSPPPPKFPAFLSLSPMHT